MDDIMIADTRQVERTARPSERDLPVLEAAFLDNKGQFREWANAHGGTNEDGDHALAMMVFAAHAPDNRSADAYHLVFEVSQYGGFVAHFADLVLVKLVDSVLRSLSSYTDQACRAWVMTQMVRMPDGVIEGAAIEVKTGPMTMPMMVAAVDKTTGTVLASAMTGDRQRVLRVSVEDIVRVLPVGKSNNGGGNNPVGGTPVAQAA
jgi:hypothetical protein